MVLLSIIAGSTLARSFFFIVSCDKITELPDAQTAKIIISAIGKSIFSITTLLFIPSLFSLSQLEAWFINIKKSFMIGDSYSDLEAAKKTKIKFIKVGEKKFSSNKNYIIKKNLTKAVNYILK